MSHPLSRREVSGGGLEKKTKIDRHGTDRETSAEELRNVPFTLKERSEWRGVEKKTKIDRHGQTETSAEELRNVASTLKERSE